MSMGNNLNIQLVKWQTKCGVAIWWNTLDNKKEQTRIHGTTQMNLKRILITLWKKPEARHHAVYDSIYMKCPKKAIETKSRLVIAGGGEWGEHHLTINVHEESFLNFLFYTQV